ncbi:MAG: hypothetical protein M3340_04765 [Actinomycetota bacterium]|nr:hypothetical protein [Actinomycetota bacterium]
MNEQRPSPGSAAIEHVRTRYADDPDYRERFRADPEAAMREAEQETGDSLSDEQWDALKRTDWGGSHESFEKGLNAIPAPGGGR